MKITKRQLQQIIKEELSGVIKRELLSEMIADQTIPYVAPPQPREAAATKTQSAATKTQSSRPPLDPYWADIMQQTHFDRYLEPYWNATPAQGVLPGDLPVPTASTKPSWKSRPVGDIKASKAGGDYDIVRGDTLGAIAQAHGVSVRDMMLANPHIEKAKLIRAGDTLKIPGGKAGGTTTAPTTAPTTSTSLNKDSIRGWIGDYGSTKENQAMVRKYLATQQRKGKYDGNIDNLSDKQMKKVHNMLRRGSVWTKKDNPTAPVT